MVQRNSLPRKASPKSLKLSKSFVGSTGNSVMGPAKKATKKQTKAVEKSRKPGQSNERSSDKRAPPLKKNMIKSKSVIS